MWQRGAEYRFSVWARLRASSDMQKRSAAHCARNDLWGFSFYAILFETRSLERGRMAPIRSKTDVQRGF